MEYKFSYVLSCCSTADMTAEQLASRQISYAPFHFVLDGVDYLDDLGKTMTYDEFYKKLDAGSISKTSQINIQEFVEYFERILQSGKDILHLSLSSGISGVVQSATAAAGILRPKYPERKIFVVDSMAASSGYGLIMDDLADMRDAGASIEEVRDWIEANKMKMHHWFFSGDLTTFIRGGRVSKTAGTIGNVLGVCPVLNVDKFGKLTQRAKVLSKKKAIKELASRMVMHAQDGENYTGKCIISNSNCIGDAQALAAILKETFPKIKSIVINPIGTTIGSHTGSGTVALFFWGDERAD